MTPAPLVAMGQSSDPHFRYAVETLTGRGDAFILVDIDDPPAFALLIDRDGRVSLSHEGKAFDLGTFYFRLKFPLTAMRPDFAPGLEDVVRMEWTAFASGLGHLFMDRTISSPKMARPQCKLAQLVDAARAGFAVPRTLVGLGKGNVEAFSADHPEMIFKAIHASRVAHEGEAVFDILMTTRLDRADLADISEDEFRACPVLIQERLDNSCEHRVIAFGDEVFSYRAVDVPGVTPMQDRRIMAPNFKLVDASDALRARIRRYFEISGLRYGVFDLLVQDDRIVFLECNPEGQWHSANGLNVRDLLSGFAEWAVERGKVAPAA